MQRLAIDFFQTRVLISFGKPEVSNSIGQADDIHSGGSPQGLYHHDHHHKYKAGVDDNSDNRKEILREAIIREKKRFFVKSLHKMVTPPVPLL